MPTIHVLAVVYVSDERKGIIGVRVFILVVVVSVGLTGASSGAAQTKVTGKALSAKKKSAPESCPYARLGVSFYRGRFIFHQIQRKASLPTWRKPRNCADARYLANVWAKRAHVARVKTALWRKNAAIRERRALYEKWRCIHEHEGAWDANTGNGYYGGLQMDLSFQQAHGPQFLARWGTANNWPVWAQIEAAENAYATRGFGPWPNTRLMCGQ